MRASAGITTIPWHDVNGGWSNLTLSNPNTGWAPLKGDYLPYPQTFSSGSDGILFTDSAIGSSHCNVMVTLVTSYAP